MARSSGSASSALRHLAFLRAWGASTTYPLLLHLYARSTQGVPPGAGRVVPGSHRIVHRPPLPLGGPHNVLNRLFIAADRRVHPRRPGRRSASPRAVTRRAMDRQTSWPGRHRHRALLLAWPRPTAALGSATPGIAPAGRGRSRLRQRQPLDRAHHAPDTQPGMEAELSKNGHDPQESSNGSDTRSATSRSPPGTPSSPTSCSSARRRSSATPNSSSTSQPRTPPAGVSSRSLNAQVR